MNALILKPGIANSLNLKDVPEPDLADGELLCEMLMLGICGTDIEISQGKYGQAPSGCEYLILGHESLGRVLESPAESVFKKGDLIVGFVRRPDPVPCAHCARDEWDMCSNGLYQERGIKQLHGYASERYRLSQNYAIKLDPKLLEVGVLLEPASVVAKAWEQIQRIGARTEVPPKRALITGAGPVGLLAALIGVQRGFEVHVYDLAKDGIKPELVRELGATYHSNQEALKRSDLQFDITLECTGAPELIFQLFNQISANGILCLAGVSSGGRDFPLDMGALNLNIVLQNEVIFGSVNANRRHYQAAKESLESANLDWLKKLITRRVPLVQWQNGFKKGNLDIKVVLTNDSPRAQGL